MQVEETRRCSACARACAARFPFVSGTEYSDTWNKKRVPSLEIARWVRGWGFVRTDETRVHIASKQLVALCALSNAIQRG